MGWMKNISMREALELKVSKYYVCSVHFYTDGFELMYSDGKQIFVEYYCEDKEDEAVMRMKELKGKGYKIEQGVFYNMPFNIN